MRIKFTLIFTYLFLFNGLNLLLAQADTVYLNNPSFEDYPRHSKGVKGWYDCGFPGETAPDVQPFYRTQSLKWGQLLEAKNGKTYLGMVVRDNDTYERVSQKVSSPLLANQCYEFEIWLCRSNAYLSKSQKTKAETNFIDPAVLRVWGSNSFCGRNQLLGETQAVSNEHWQKFKFTFKPTQDFSVIMLEAFYKVPTLIVYNGHLLIDNASAITPIACPDQLPDEAIAGVDEIIPDTSGQSLAVNENKNIIDIVLRGPEKKLDNKSKELEEKRTTNLKTTEVKKVKILKELDKNTMVKGQRIQIQNLFFAANDSTIRDNSLEVLDQITTFLVENPSIQIEIGGHTNNTPPAAFCNRLSTSRAKAVVNYLIVHGVKHEQLTHKGYGKNKPLVSNNTLWGRKRNQRVEIRVTDMGNQIGG